jgi:hypothetical protein
MNRIFRILEIVWLVVGCFGIIATAYFVIIQDMRSAVFFLIFTLVSGIIYSIRKRQRKIYEGSHKKDQQGK